MSSSTVGLMDSALAFHQEVLGPIPGSGVDEISSKFPDSLFISKEILNAEISKIGPCDNTYGLCRAQSTTKLCPAQSSTKLCPAQSTTKLCPALSSTKSIV